MQTRLVSFRPWAVLATGAALGMLAACSSFPPATFPSRTPAGATAPAPATAPAQAAAHSRNASALENAARRAEPDARPALQLQAARAWLQAGRGAEAARVLAGITGDADAGAGHRARVHRSRHRTCQRPRAAGLAENERHTGARRHDGRAAVFLQPHAHRAGCRAAGRWRARRDGCRAACGLTTPSAARCARELLSLLRDGARTGRQARARGQPGSHRARLARARRDCQLRRRRVAQRRDRGRALALHAIPIHPATRDCWRRRWPRRSRWRRACTSSRCCCR